MKAIPARDFHGHPMVRNGDLWVSRGPFARGDWQYNAGRLQDIGQGFFVLEERQVGERVHRTLKGFPDLARFRDYLGPELVKADFGDNEERGGKREVVFNKDFTIVGGQFFLLDPSEAGINLIRHPMTGVTQFHAQGMSLAIGADLMTDAQYISLAQGRDHFTPNGTLYGPNGEEYAVTSLKRARTGTVDIEDSDFPTDPITGTRHYTGNVWKWTQRNPSERNQFGCRGGSCIDDGAEGFAASCRLSGHPDGYGDDLGFLAVAPA